MSTNLKHTYLEKELSLIESGFAEPIWLTSSIAFELDSEGELYGFFDNGRTKHTFPLNPDIAYSQVAKKQSKLALDELDIVYQIACLMNTDFRTLALDDLEKTIGQVYERIERQKGKDDPYEVCMDVQKPFRDKFVDFWWGQGHSLEKRRKDISYDSFYIAIAMIAEEKISLGQANLTREAAYLRNSTDYSKGATYLDECVDFLGVFSKSMGRLTTLTANSTSRHVQDMWDYLRFHPDKPAAIKDEIKYRVSQNPNRW